MSINKTFTSFNNIILHLLSEIVISGQAEATRRYEQLVVSLVARLDNTESAAIPSGVYISIPVKTVEELDALLEKAKEEKNIQFLVCFIFVSDIHDVHLEKNKVIHFSSVHNCPA